MSTKRTKILLPSLLLIAVASAAIAIAAGRPREAVTSPREETTTMGLAEPQDQEGSREASPQTEQRNQERRERVEAELITLTPNGFAPAEITRPAGRFLLLVVNRSGEADINLRLEAEDDGRGARRRIPAFERRRRQRHDIVDLPPGRYTLTIADHPDWVCRLTITER